MYLCYTDNYSSHLSSGKLLFAQMDIITENYYENTELWSRVPTDNIYNNTLAPKYGLRISLFSYRRKRKVVTARRGSLRVLVVLEATTINCHQHDCLNMN